MHGPLLDCKKNPKHANLLGTLTILRILSIPVSLVAQYTRKKRKRTCSCVCYELQSSAKAIFATPVIHCTLRVS